MLLNCMQEICYNKAWNLQEISSPKLTFGICKVSGPQSNQNHGDDQV
jgi:hypothetical protein